MRRPAGKQEEEAEAEAESEAEAANGSGRDVESQPEEEEEEKGEDAAAAWRAGCDVLVVDHASATGLDMPLDTLALVRGTLPHCVVLYYIASHHTVLSCSVVSVLYCKLCCRLYCRLYVVCYMLYVV